MVDHVNAVIGSVYAPLRGSSVKNCAACTAAGAVNLTMRKSEISSAIVADALGCHDNVHTMGETRDGQTSAIAAYVQGRTGRAYECSERDMSLYLAEQWMRNKPEHTVFAVLADGEVNGIPEQVHWLNAILAGGIIRYFDFQSMRKSKVEGQFVGHANPATSTAPFMGVVTQTRENATNKELHSPDQSGAFAASVKLTVVAFPPG